MDKAKDLSALETLIPLLEQRQARGQAELDEAREALVRLTGGKAGA